MALTLIVGVLPTQPANASDWVVVGQGNDKSITLIDAASLRVAGSSVQFFSKTIPPTPAAKSRKKTARHKESPAYTILENTADCRQRTLTLMQWVDYGKNGQVLSSRQLAYPTASAVIPDSIGEAMLNFVCGAPQ